MGKLHITIENAVITGVHCTDNVKKLQSLYPNSNIIDVDESFGGSDGESINLFDENWTRRRIILI
jgi:hypothetical protein